MAAILLAKLLDEHLASFVRSEGDFFIVSVNGQERTISRDAWRLLPEQEAGAQDRVHHLHHNRGHRRRYFVDKNGRRVLIGLTIEETFEFETLDILPALDESGNHVAWDENGLPTTTRELFLAIVSLTFLWDGTAVAQGTKDPSNPIPSMVYPIRPRDEPPTPQSASGHDRA